MNLTLEQMRSMSKEEIAQHYASLEADLNKLRVADVTDPQISSNGNPYFSLRVKEGIDRTITRNLYGVNNPDGSVNWQNLSPEEAFALQMMGTNLKGKLRLETVEIVPEKVILPDGSEATRQNGDPVFVHQRTVIVIGSESPEQACRRSGSVPASQEKASEEEVSANGQVAA